MATKEFSIPKKKIEGILSLLVQMFYHEYYVSTQSNTVGHTNPKVSPADCVRQESVLSRV